MFTKVGEDPFGEVAIAELRDFGVDTRFVGVEPGTVTPLAFAVLDPPEDPQLLFRRDPPVPDFQLPPGRRRPRDRRRRADPVGDRRARCRRSRARRRRAGDAPAPARAGATRCSTSTTGRRSGARARRRRRGSAQPSSTRRSRSGNREECAVAVGTDDPREAAARLRAKGVELAIVKLGGDGVLLSSEQAEQLIEPPQIEVVCGLGRGRRVRRRALPRAAGRMAARAHDRVRQRGRRDRRLAAVVLAGDAVRAGGRRDVGRSAAPDGGALVESRRHEHDRETEDHGGASRPPRPPANRRRRDRLRLARPGAHALAAPDPDAVREPRVRRRARRVQRPAAGAVGAGDRLVRIQACDRRPGRR